MQVMAFFPCEKSVARMDGSTDILRFGILNLNIKKKKGNEYATAIINFHSLIKFSAVEKGQKTIQLFLVDQDGRTMSTSPAFNIDTPAQETNINVGGEFPLKCNNSGQHSLNLVIDKRIEAEWPINIKLIDDKTTESN